MWISYGNFEASIGEPKNARSIFEEADMSLREPNQKEERVLCLEVIGGKIHKKRRNKLFSPREKEKVYIIILK